MYSPATAIGPPGGLRQRLSVYARLGNLKVYFQWLPVVVAWSLLPEPFGIAPAHALALVLFVLAIVGVAAAAGTLDDVEGVRDGIDQQTYAENEERAFSSKPLVLGEIDEPGAMRFAIAAGAGGVALGVVAIAIAPHQPAWLFAFWLFVAWVATQYSYGTKLSYHGAGELLLAFEAFSLALIPLVFSEGELRAEGLFQALLLATLFAQVTLFSSSHDAETDRAAGRMTLAARLTPAANRRLIAGEFVIGWAVTAAGFATGALEPWLLVALLPTWAIQVGQLVEGVGRGRWLVARRLGWQAFNTGVAALVVVNLLAG
jgi:1,4-dihydroxy-2-naphthoate octaprenyltransferase